MRSKKTILLALGLGLLLFKTSSSESAGSEYKFGELTNLADKYETDKGSSGQPGRPSHNYTEVYEYFFYPIKYTALKICEIGIGTGASLKMFRDYFPNAVIYGIDIENKIELSSATIKTFIADQANRKQLKAFINAYGNNFEIILDDGGHSMEQQQISFGYLFKYLKPGGYYIIEDVHTSLYIPPEGKKYEVYNATLAMIDNYIREGKIESEYMAAEEADYLTANIEYVNLLSRNSGRSITCLIKKKDNPGI